MSFNKNGTVSFRGIDTLQSIFGMETKSLDDGSIWARIHYLDVSSNTTFFANAAEVAECTDKTNRYSLMKYVDNFKTKTYKMTNMASAINGTSGFSSSFATASSTHVKYGSNALLLTGTTDKVEVTATSTATYTLEPTHTYYVRVEIYQETKQGSADFYWPIVSNGNIASKSVSDVNTWTMVSNTRTQSAQTAGSYAFRLDYNNSSTAGQMWFDGVMIVDLTETFGSGCEPDATWCDANIPYFTGTKDIEAIEIDAQSRYEFMLTYPLLSSTLYNRWTQTSSPNAGTVTGLRKITTAWGTHNGGIRKHGSYCIYDCDTGDTWFAAIGQTAAWQTSTDKWIPAADGNSQKATELWVRIDNLSQAELTRIYNGYLSATDIIEF